MFAIFRKLKITTAMALASGGFFIVAMFVIGFIVYEVADNQAIQSAVAKQDASLRVAATIFEERIDGAKVTWSSDGKVNRIELAACRNSPTMT